MTTLDLESAGFLAPGRTAGEADAALRAAPPESDGASWIARALLALGAWMAGIFFCVFLGITIDFDSGGAPMVVGALVLAGSIALVRGGRGGIFVEQLALSTGLAGLLLFLAGAGSELASAGVGSRWPGHIQWLPLIAAGLAAIAYPLAPHPVLRFFSVFLISVMAWIGGFESHLQANWKLVPAAIGGAAAVFGLLAWRPENWDWKPAFWGSLVGLAGTLLAAGAAINFREEDVVAPSVVVAGVAAAGSLIVLLAALPPAGRRALPLLAFAGLLGILVLGGAPGCVVSLGLLVIAHTLGDRRLECLSAIGLGIFLIAFYYHLDTTLGTKSWVMIGSGITLLAVASVLARKRKESAA